MTKLDLEFYVGLPWTVLVERRAGREDEPDYFSATIAELPGFAATGVTDRELEEDFWEALACHLSSYLDCGEAPPIPASVQKAVQALQEHTPTAITTSVTAPERPFAGDPWSEPRSLERLTAVP